MIARLCDSCKKVIGEKEMQRVNTDFFSYELCEDCKEKFMKIKDDFDIKSKELHKKHDVLYENFKNKLKEMGLNS